MKVEDVINREELYARFDDDLDLLEELIELFLEDSPSLMSEIQSAVSAQDAMSLRRAAHTLKGAVGNFCAPGAFEASQELENDGAVGNLSSVSANFDRLQNEMAQVTQALRMLSEEFAE